MENKEPKVFKTLVHKETGEWVKWSKDSMNEVCLLDTAFPHLVSPIQTIESLEEYLEEDLSNFDFDEVIVLKKSEYERLKQDSQILKAL